MRLSKEDAERLLSALFEFGELGGGGGSDADRAREVELRECDAFRQKERSAWDAWQAHLASMHTEYEALADRLADFAYGNDRAGAATDQRGSDDLG